MKDAEPTGGEGEGVGAPRLAAVLLAAGESSRMQGLHKVLLDAGGEPLVVRRARTLQAAGLDPVVVVTGHRAEAVEAALAPVPGLIVVRHEAYREGQQSSVLAGLRVLHEVIGAAQAFAVVLCDQPLLDVQDFQWLRQAWGRRLPSCKVLVPVHQGVRGNPVVFDRDCLERILAEDPEGGARRFIERHPSQVLRLEAPNDHFCVDLDTREDLARWRARVPRSGG